MRKHLMASTMTVDRWVDPQYYGILIFGIWGALKLETFENLITFANQTVGNMAKDSREHILEVSLMLFLQKSFKAVTMKEIVEKTGLSKGAFYHYFESKEQVFEEVVRHFYQELFVQDFDHFSQDSLEAFYKDYLKDIENKLQQVRKIGLSISKTADWNINHYVLIFDAVMLFPFFKKLNEENVQGQIKAWKKIVRTARSSGEIETLLSDTEIAKMFVYLGDGFGLNEILKTKKNIDRKFQKDMERLWGGFYDLLKV